MEANGFNGIFYDMISYIQALFTADVILYLSPVGSGFIIPLKYLTGKKVIVNHGGLNEWKREKLSTVQKICVKFNHLIAAKFADVNIVDNLLYQKSLKNTFKANSTVIRYGGDHVIKIEPQTINLIKKYPFVNDNYAVNVSRAQIDNNIHLVLKSFENFNGYKIVLISNWDISKYGRDLKHKYINHPNMILLDAIYDKEELDYLRGNALVYIHSHSRCGTAPSLVEAMCLKKAIISFDVQANRETTQNNAFFFSSADSLVEVLNNISLKDIKNNEKLMADIGNKEYNWKTISNEYRVVIDSLLK